MTRQRIISEIVAERARQDELWGGAEHDSKHTLERWLVILMRHVGLCAWDGSPDDVCHRTEKTAKYDPKRYRRELVEVAAVAVAALEAFDRKAAQSNGHAPTLPAPGADGDPRLDAGPGELWAQTPATPGARMTPEEWAQATADRLQAPVLLFDRRPHVGNVVEACTHYLVVEAQADKWESQESNRVARYEPRTA